MKKVFKYIQDPGHGWLVVERSFLESLGILSAISSFSYQRGSKVYVEEDSDANLLITTLKEKGIEYSVKSTHTNRSSPVRNYQSFSFENPPLKNSDIVPGMEVLIYGKVYRVDSVIGKHWRVTDSNGNTFRAPIHLMQKINQKQAG